jgi:hypothetical protein
MATKNQDTVSTLIDEVDSNTIYVGIASRATITSASSWQIIKILTTGTVTSVLYPNGNDGFLYIWDNRTTYTYQ